MKKFFKFAAVAAIVAMIASCGKEPGPEPTPDPDPNTGGTTTEYTENLTFTLEVTEVEADKAKIKVEHNGTTKDTWYGFATTETDVQKAIDAVLAEGNVTLKKNTSTTVTARGLEPETEYTFVAVGIKADGTTYGEPATVEFTTVAAAPPAPDNYTVNPAWSIDYIHNFEYQGQIYEHVVEITSADENPYFMIAWPKGLYDQYGIDAIAQAEIDGWKEYLAGTQYSFADILYVGGGLIDISDLIDVEKYGNEWYAIAVGADVNGNPTNLYAISNLITVEEEELDPAYAEWLGDWTFTGANGVAWNVTMKKGVANTSYKLAGWEGPESEGLDIKVDWFGDYGYWAILAQSFGVYNFGQQAGNGEIWLTPQDTEGYIWPEAGVPACIGGLTEDGEKMVIGYSEEMEDGSMLEMTTMMYLVQLEADSQFYGITSVTEWPTFPITVTPATTTSALSVDKQHKVGAKKIDTQKTFNTFGASFMIR